MANTTVRLDGMDGLLRQLQRVPEVVRKHAAPAVALSALRVANRARALVPVGSTGLLKASIDYEHLGDSLSAGVGLRTADAFYWRYVEFGTRYVAARPFFRPAAEDGAAAFIRDMADIGPQIEHDLAEGRT